MSTTKRILLGLAQVIVSTLVGYIVAFLTVMVGNIGQFEVALAIAAIIGGVIIALLGRLFKMPGRFLFAIIGAVIGAAIGMGIIYLIGAVGNAPGIVVFALVLLPATLGTIAFQWSGTRTSTPASTV